MTQHLARTLSGLWLVASMSAAFGAPPAVVTDQVIPLPIPGKIVSPAFTGTPLGPILSWLEPRASGGHALRYAFLAADGWSETRTVLAGDRFWISPADPPSLSAFDDGTLVARWPRRAGDGWYDYATHVALKPPGQPWGASFRLHDDAGPVQHGLVSSVRQASDRIHYLWLDERSGTVALRGRSLNADGTPGPDTLLDAQTCSCCRIALVALPDGDLLAAYRDRSNDEIRDIRMLRHSGITGWRATGWVSDDGWKITGCPVNGPDLAVHGERVALAWFSAADDRNQVLLVRSRDGGATFSEPRRIDAGDPIGRPTLHLDANGTVTVAWLEQTAGMPQLLIRRVPDDENPAPPHPVANVPSGYLGGYPELVTDGDALLLFWPNGDSAHLVRLGRVH